MNLYSDIELLEGSLRGLSSASQAEIHRSSDDIKRHVEAAARELSLERFGNFENELYQVQCFSFFQM